MTPTHRLWLDISLSTLLIALLLPPIFIYWALVPLILAAGFTLYKERPKAKWNMVGTAAALSWCWQVVSLTWSAAPKTGVSLILDMLPLSLLCMGSMWIRLEEEELVRIFRPFAWAACLFLIGSAGTFFYSCHELQISPLDWPIFRKATIEYQQPYYWVFRFMGKDPLHGYYHPSYNTLPLFFASAAAIWMGKNHRFPWWVAALMTVCTFVLVVLIQSRMGLIYSAIIISAALVYACPGRRSRLIMGASLLALGISGSTLCMPQLKEMEKDPTRDELFLLTSQYLQHRPLLGTGIGAMNPIELCRTLEINHWPHIPFEIDTTQPIDSWEAKRNMVPHNQFLADWVQGGIVAFILTILLYVGACIRTVRSGQFWAPVMMLIFLIFSILEPPLYIAKGMYGFGMMVLLSSPRARKKENSD